MANEGTFKFLITTDNHMGYKLDDDLRRKDPFYAFEEALEIARIKDVDFILLGGDLFHVNRPSSTIEHKCIKIIRRHMNAKSDRDVSFKRIKGNFCHFNKVSHANFEDENLKVPYPIMTIHGNHDDPTGPQAQSVCEKLSTCGLLNYFGSIRSGSKVITIDPIIFQKAHIKIALYGLGFIPDFKLRQAILKNELQFSEAPDGTFNVLIVHQNRVNFNEAKCIPDDMFPPFFHLIIRGHEHATMKPEPLPNSKVNGMVYQPGSTTATSISLMEAAPKRVGIVSVSAPMDSDGTGQYSADYEMIDLKCSRRILFDDVSQKQIFKYIKQTSGTVKVTSAEFQHYSCEYVQSRIDKLLELYSEEQRKLLSVAASSTGGDENSRPVKRLSHFRIPLVRIRLEYSSKSERFDELELSSKYFPDHIANKNIILFKKQKLREIENGKTENVTFAQLSMGISDNLCHDSDDDEDTFDFINLGEQKRDTIDLMIENYFKEKPKDQRLVALSLEEYTNAVRGSAEDGNVISKVLNEKRRDILLDYYDVIKNEQLSTSTFNNEETISKWFTDAFEGKQIKYDSEAKEEVLDFTDGSESDIMICD